jgi:hypothetical protein
MVTLAAAHFTAVGRADESRLAEAPLLIGANRAEMRRLPPTDSSDSFLCGHQEAIAEVSRVPSMHDVWQPQALPESPQFALREIAGSPPSVGNGDGDEGTSSASEKSSFLGYDGGFLIAANQGVDDDSASVDFLMRVNGWLQLRHTLFDSHGPNPDQNTISFERLRLVFGGHVFSPDLGYFLQFDGNSDRLTDVIFLDYFVTYDVGHGVLGCGENKLGIKLGKWKVPFSRSREESGRRLEFADRATANVFFDLNRSIGAGLYGRLDPLAVPFHYETAVFNGFRTGSFSTTGRDGELDRNFAWSLRSYADLGSDFGADGEPDLSWHALPTLRLGGGLAFTRVDDEGVREFNQEFVVDSGRRLASILPDGISAYDVWLFTIDTHLKYRGLSIIAEYYWRYISQFSGGNVPSLYDDGFVLQTGYFICPKTLEVLFRWSRIVGNSGTLGLNLQSADEVSTGFVWYIKGHNAKLTFDVSHRDGSPLSSSRLDILPGDEGWLYRTQFQLAF